ncbi:hypothetical protein [Deefgea rivuli]|uniref:hypothetical protein n=1 Tax=Deefgea rivuli TaxID=400948 RepID=UPI0004889481|nr:hypothetical protein [Deefgea rivuli]
MFFLIIRSIVGAALLMIAQSVFASEIVENDFDYGRLKAAFPETPEMERWHTQSPLGNSVRYSYKTEEIILGLSSLGPVDKKNQRDYIRNIYRKIQAMQVLINHDRSTPFDMLDKSTTFDLVAEVPGGGKKFIYKFFLMKRNLIEALAIFDEGNEDVARDFLKSISVNAK